MMPSRGHGGVQIRVAGGHDLKSGVRTRYSPGSDSKRLLSSARLLSSSALAASSSAVRSPPAAPARRSTHDSASSALLAFGEVDANIDTITGFAFFSEINELHRRSTHRSAARSLPHGNGRRHGRMTGLARLATARSPKRCPLLRDQSHISIFTDEVSPMQLLHASC
jgi:hypothetical protein